MKKLLTISLLFITALALAQNPVQVKQPQKFLSYIIVDSPAYYATGCGAPGLPTSTIKKSTHYFDSCGHHEYRYDPALRAWKIADSGSAGSNLWGSILGTLGSQADLMAKFGTKYDTSARKMDTLYAITDSTYGLYINGQFRTFKARGALLNFNGRVGAIVLNSSDVGTALGFFPIAPADTVAKWVGHIYRSHDSVFACVGATCFFQYRDSVGGNLSPGNLTSVSGGTVNVGPRANQNTSMSMANLYDFIFDSVHMWRVMDPPHTTSIIVDWSTPEIDLNTTGGAQLRVRGDAEALINPNTILWNGPDSASWSTAKKMALRFRDSAVVDGLAPTDTTHAYPMAWDRVSKKWCYIPYWTGGGTSGPVNLDTTRTATILTITNSGGTNAKIPLVDIGSGKAGLESPSVAAFIDSLMKGISFSDSLYIYRPPGTDSIYACIFNIRTGVTTCRFQYLDSSGVSGPAGGDLTGTYPNPTILPSAVTTAKINNNAVTNAKMQNGGAFKIAGYNATGDFVQLALGPGLASDGSTASATGIPEQTVGSLFSRNGITSLSFGTTNGSGQTNSVSGNYAIFKSDGTVLGGRSFDIDSLSGRNGSGFTDMENWIFWVGARVPVKSSVTKLAIGLRSQVSALNNNVIAVFDLSTGVNAGKLLLYTSANTLVETSTSSLSVSATDSVALFMQRYEGKIYVWAQDVTTQSNNLTMLPFTFFFLNGGLFNDVPNMGKFAIFNASDSSKIGSINIYSPEIKFPALMCITDSKGYLYSGPYEKTWVAQLQHAYGSVVRSGGSSETAGDVLNRLPEIIAIHPKTVLLSVGRNGGLADTTNYIAVVSALQAAGITVIHFIEGYDATWAAGGVMDTFIAFVYRRWGANNVIDGNTPIKNCGDCTATDAVHYNAHGEDVEYFQVITSPVAYTLVARGTMTGAMTGNVDGNAVAFGAGQQKSLTSSQKFLYDDINGVTLNNKGLFKLDQNASSNWVFQNSTAGSSAAAQVQVLGDANSMALWQQSSLSASYGAATSHASVFYSFGNPAVILSDNGPFIITTNGNIEKVRVNNNGEMQINNTTDLGPYKFQNTGDAILNGNIIQTKSGATFPFSSTIGATAGNYWQFGYTPAPLSFTKATALVIDTNNNVSIGANIIGNTAPLYAAGNSTLISGLQSFGGIYHHVLTVTTGTTTIDGTYDFINVDASGGNVIINLPAASSVFGASMGIKYVFYRTDGSANTVTINRAGSDTINGLSSATITGQYTTAQLNANTSSTWAKY